jgi:hypothetical protein
MHRAIYLSNSANQDFQAIIIPSGAWEWSQIWSLEACRAWSSMSAIQTTHDFYKWYKSASTGEWTPEWAKVISMFFDSYATKVSAGESKELYNSTRPNEYFNKNLWDKFNIGSNWWIFLRTKDGKYTSAFNSNENHAWITEGKNQGYEVISAKPGKVWHADMQASRHGFEQVKTGVTLSVR